MKTLPALLVLSGLTAALAAPLPALAQYGNYRVQSMNFDLWCQEDAKLPVERCDKRLPEDVQVFVAHRAKVIDDGDFVHAQTLGQLIGQDHPRVVGKADQFATHRPRHRQRNSAGQGAARDLREMLPCRFKAGMFIGFQRGRFAQHDRAIIAKCGNGETRVGAADIYRNEFHESPPSSGL